MFKKTYLFLTLLLTALFLLPWSGAKADPLTLSIGNNDTGLQTVPIYTTQGDRRYHDQFIYSSSQLSAMNGKLITKMSFPYRTAAGTTFTNVEISLKEISASSYSDANFLSTTGATSVYSGSVDATGTTVTITFTTSFAYNGGNLLVDFMHNTTGGGYVTGTSNGKCKATSGGAYVSLYTYTTTSTLPTSGTQSTYRPDVTFTYEDAPTSSSCEKPGTPAASEITANSAKLTWDAAEGVTNYQFVRVAKGATPDWTGVASQAVTTVTYNDLTKFTDYDFYVRSYCGDEEGEQSAAEKVSFKTLKSCYEPTTLGVVEAEITSSSAKITWSASGHGETQWQYTYGVYGSTPNWTGATVTNEKEATLSGLNPASLYQVWVRSYCDAGDQSEAITEYFATECGTVTGDGWSQNFDEETAYPDCWKSWGATPSLSTSSWYVHSGKGLYYYGGTGNMIVILPEFTEIANQTKTLQLTLWYSNYSSSYTGDSYASPQVGWITNPNDASTFHAVETLAKVASWTEASVALAGAPAGSLVAIRYGGASYSGYLLLDDFSVSEAPSCLAPSSAAGVATAYNEASISWTANGSESAWKLQYSADGGSNWTDANSGNSITTNPYTLTGLSANSSYVVHVKADCGGGEFSDWSANSAAFSTPCGPADASDYNETFESTTAGSGKLPDCWDYKQSYNGYGTIYPYVYNGSAYAGSKCLYFYGGVSSSEQIIRLPEMDEAIKDLTISFYFKNEASAYSTRAKLIVGYLSADGTTFNAIETLDYASGYTLYKKELSSAANDASYIAIRYAGGSSAGYAYIDNIHVFPTPSCVEPTSVSASSITANSASISWTNGGEEAAWRLQYTTVNPASATDGDWTDANSGNDITTKPFTLENLAASTTYYARVKAVCSGSDQSEWSEASAAFTTLCAAVSTLPWTENFNDKTVNELPLCWSAAGNTSAVYVASSSSYITFASGNALYFTGGSGTDVYVLLPDFEAALNTLQIEFSHVEESNTASGKIEVGYYKNSSFTALRTCDYSTSSSAWRNESAVVLSDVPAGAQLAFHYKPISSAYTAAIDNITVSVAPSCAVPDGLGTSAIAANSATIFWAAGSASAWKLQYKAEGDANWSAEQSISTNPTYELTNLTGNTLYYVRVKADCGGGDLSEYSDGTFSFRTECEAKTVTALVDWTEDFESQTADAMPSCWKRISGADEVIVSATGGKTDAKSLRFKGLSPLVAMPEMNADVKDLIVTLSANCGYNTASYYGQIAIGYVVGSDFTEVDRISKVYNTYETKTVEMPNDAPITARLALKTVGGSYSTTIYIDEITVSLKPVCPTPTAINVAATSSNATITWTDETNDKWNLRWREVTEPESAWNLVEDLDVKSYTISSGLATGKTYEVQVQTVCSSNTSDWYPTTAETFALVCNAPTALAVTARTQNSATFSWTSTESAWKLQYKAEGDADWTEENVATNPFTLENLAAGTNYQAQIQSACGSAFTDAVSFTTWCGVKDASELPINITSFSAVPECWEATFKGEWSQVANGKICFYGTEGQWLVLPAYDINLNQLSVTFTFTTSGATPEFGYIDAPNGAFHAFGSALTSGVELDLAAEAAAVKYIAVRYPGGSGEFSNVMITAVNIRRTPGCAKLDAPVATPGVGSASISWTAGSENAWDLQYKLASAADWTDATGTIESPFALSGLAQGASYNVRVRANCAEEGVGDWSDETTFTTNCAAINALPFIETFDAALSNCWTVYSENTEYYASNVFGGSLNLPGGKDGAGHVVVLPEITASLTNTLLTIEYTVPSNAETPELGYVTDPADKETFVQFTELDKSASEARIDVSSLPAGAHLALRYDGTGSAEGTFAVQEIRILEQLNLADNVNNSAILDANNGKIVDVVIGRTFTRNYGEDTNPDHYNTICLPFSLSAEELAASPIASNDLWAFKYAKVDEATNELQFRIVEADHIEAGKPYFIGFPANEENIVNPLFKNVTITASAGQNVGDAVAQLCGILKPEKFYKGDQKKLFLYTQTNTLYWWNGSDDSQLNGFRAFFYVPGNSDSNGAPIRFNMSARIVKEEQTATGIENTTLNENGTMKVLENNQVVIIRNGVKYTLQGQKIQ